MSAEGPSQGRAGCACAGWFAASLGLVTLLANTARAENPAGAAPPDASTVGEVVVTAERRSESLSSVPISVTAITTDVIRGDHIQGIGDYFSQTPNVAFVDNGSRDRTDISIRGVSNQLDPTGNVRPSAYGFYIDDFNVQAITSNPQIQDMERIEILRGPQATYFGRNAEAGAINISTNQPESRWYEEVGFDYSSFNTRNVSAVLNAPLTQTLAVRLSGQDEFSDGNIRNINPIGGGNDHHYQDYRIIALYRPGSRLEWDSSFDYADERAGMRDGVPTGFLTATWRAVYYHNAPGNVANPDGVGFFPENDDRVNFNTPQAVGSTYYWGRSRLKYDFDTMTLTAIGGYGHSRSYNIGDVDGGSLDIFNETNWLTRDTLNGEVRLQSNTGGPLEWNAGLSGGRDTGSTNEQTFYGTQNPFGAKPGSAITAAYSSSTDSYAAVFGQFTYRLAPAFDVTIGGRYSFEQVTGWFLNYSNGAISNNEPRRGASFNDFSPKLTLRYTPRASLMLYVTASKGFKTGGVQASDTIIQNSYSPETLWNFEGGVKTSLLGDRLVLDVDGFYELWHDLQQSERYQYLGPTGALLFVSGIANAARAHSVGAEATTTFRPVTGLTLTANVGYTHAVYDSFTNAFVDGKVLNASGKPLPEAPEWTLSASGQYEHALGAGLQGYGRIDWNYRSQMLSSSYALRYDSFPFVSPGYNTVNFRIGIEHKNVRLSLYADNVFNARYYQNAYEKAFYSGVQVVPSDRRFGVSLTLRSN